MNLTREQFNQSVDSAVTASGRMAIALTAVRNLNGRVRAGTAAPSGIYGGTVDPVTVKARRARNKRARQARATHRRANV